MNISLICQKKIYNFILPLEVTLNYIKKLCCKIYKCDLLDIYYKGDKISKEENDEKTLLKNIITEGDSNIKLKIVLNPTLSSSTKNQTSSISNSPINTKKIVDFDENITNADKILLFKNKNNKLFETIYNQKTKKLLAAVRDFNKKIIDINNFLFKQKPNFSKNNNLLYFEKKIYDFIDSLRLYFMKLITDLEINNYAKYNDLVENLNLFYKDLFFYEDEEKNKKEVNNIINNTINNTINTITSTPINKFPINLKRSDNSLNLNSDRSNYFNKSSLKPSIKNSLILNNKNTFKKAFEIKALLLSDKMTTNTKSEYTKKDIKTNLKKFESNESLKEEKIENIKPKKSKKEISKNKQISENNSENNKEDSHLENKDNKELDLNSSNKSQSNLSQKSINNLSAITKKSHVSSKKDEKESKKEDEKESKKEDEKEDEKESKKEDEKKSEKNSEKRSDKKEENNDNNNNSFLSQQSNNSLTEIHKPIVPFNFDLLKNLKPRNETRKIYKDIPKSAFFISQKSVKNMKKENMYSTIQEIENENITNSSSDKTNNNNISKISKISQKSQKSNKTNNINVIKKTSTKDFNKTLNINEIKKTNSINYSNKKNNNKEVKINHKNGNKNLTKILNELAPMNNNINNKPRQSMVINNSQNSLNHEGNSTINIVRRRSIINTTPAYNLISNDEKDMAKALSKKIIMKKKKNKTANKFDFLI